MARPPKGKRVTTAEGSFTVNGKAANGEGSLYRERDGWWRATYVVPGGAAVVVCAVARVRKPCVGAARP